MCNKTCIKCTFQPCVFAYFLSFCFTSNTSDPQEALKLSSSLKLNISENILCTLSFDWNSIIISLKQTLFYIKTLFLSGSTMKSWWSCYSLFFCLQISLKPSYGFYWTSQTVSLWCKSSIDSLLESTHFKMAANTKMILILSLILLNYQAIIWFDCSTNKPHCLSFQHYYTVWVVCFIPLSERQTCNHYN